MPGQAAPHRDERELLLAFLEQQRDGLRFAAHGLTDDQARRTPTAGALSIGGLITHVAATERGWIDLIPGARPDGVVAGGEDEYAAEFRARGRPLAARRAGRARCGRRGDVRA